MVMDAILFICRSIFRLFVWLFCALWIVVNGFAVWLLFTPWGARFAIRETANATLGAKKVSWAELEGSLARGVYVRHLEIRDIPRLPLNNILRIQGLTARVRSLSINGIEVAIEHGRFFPHGEEAIIFGGHMADGKFSASAYTRYLNLADVRSILVEFFDVPPLRGALRDIDLTAHGAFSRPQVRGHFMVERIDRNAFSLEDSLVAADLNFVRGRPWETYGRLDLKGGHLKGESGVVINIIDGRLTLNGRPQWPDLNIKGQAVVARTKIDITVRGSRREPKLALSSDPPHSQEQLLMMLATGRNWSGWDAAVGQNKVTPELTSDFIEYIFFGGSGQKVADMLGLSDIAFIVDDKTQGVTVSKDLSKKLDVGYGVKREAGSARPSMVTQTLEGEYHLTNKVTLEIQKEFKPRSGSATTGTTTDPADIPDDRVYMRYKTRF